MRKKLSLFLVMLMALTMVLGTGITAMAADPPEGAPSSVSPCTHTSEALWYVLSWDGVSDPVVYMYHPNGSYWGGPAGGSILGAFHDPISVGRVYHPTPSGYCFCENNLPLDPEPQGNYLDSLDDMFEAAISSGSTDTIYWNVGDALPNYIMKLLYENPSLSLDFKYTYEGVEHEIYIGPGQATNDDIDWYGPSWLLKKYGEKKVLPASHGGHDSYIIAEGDTLNKLAKRFNTTIDNLLRLNPDIVDGNRIYAGNRLYY